MVRETVIKGDAGDADRPPDQAANAAGGSDDRFDDELRPQLLADVVGQRAVVDRLRIMLNAARKRGDPLGHLLFDGPPGLGKTTFATVLPREMGTECQITSGPVLTAPKDLLPYLTNASYGSILFIDEIHRMPAAVEEFIYPVMEDFRVDIALGEGLNARTINMRLKQFTLIGATTRSGLLTAPLRDRFVNREHLDFYDVDDLAEIVRRNAKKLGTTISPEATHEIAGRSRGTPRIANNLLRWTRDFVDSEADGIISTQLACDALAKREVDQLGLDCQDRRYLEMLIVVFGGGPSGVQALAHSMNLAPDTLEDEVEPFLLRCGLIQRTPRGRVATAAAFAHLKLPPPPAPDGEPGQSLLF
ncbi:MAG: Holliday junction branch migration DNA helicase RuvB [Planctomycetaceae bacterium]|nr:Holliday junction branch migration DNA helicase RuvB [Planctomycetaceae bacterium]